MFDQFRAPARAVVLWTFAVAVMGAVGVDLVARQGLAAVDASARPASVPRRAACGRSDSGRRGVAAHLSGSVADAGERDRLPAHFCGGAGCDAGGSVLAGDVGACGRAPGGMVVAGRLSRTDGRRCCFSTCRPRARTRTSASRTRLVGLPARRDRGLSARAAGTVSHRHHDGHRGRSGSRTRLHCMACRMWAASPIRCRCATGSGCGRRRADARARLYDMLNAAYVVVERRDAAAGRRV